MTRTNYWNGFATGAAIGVGISFAALLLTRTLGQGRIVRLQKSVQIGRPLEEVFNSWAKFDSIVEASQMIHSITTHGPRSHWVIEINGRDIEWDAEVEQYIPNQAIGWKSLNGPKHTGRVAFSPLGNDTLISVTMNYVPPVGILRMAPIKERIQDIFEQTLRDFKAALERKGQQEIAGTGTTGTHFHTAETTRGTGTFGVPPERTVSTQQTRFGGPNKPVEHTPPPDAKS